MDLAKLLIVCPDKAISDFMQTKMQQNIPTDNSESWEILTLDFNDTWDQQISKLMSHELTAAVFYDPLDNRMEAGCGVVAETCLLIGEHHAKCLIYYYAAVPDSIPTDLLIFGTPERHVNVRPSTSVHSIGRDMEALIKRVALLPVMVELPPEARVELYNAVEAG